MSNIELKGLAERMWKCPFADSELFDSSLAFWSHLCESHGKEISKHHRPSWQIPFGDIDERPEKLTFCAHCFAFVVPNGPGRNPISEIDAHIQEQHPNPFGPRKVTISISTDSKLIDQFMEQQILGEVYECAQCSQSFSDQAFVAEHWIKDHCDKPTQEDVAHLLATDPQRLEDVLKYFLETSSTKEGQNHSDFLIQDDDYIIRHSPNVPRVRSRPTEHIVLVEREPVRFLDEELRELLEHEGLDGGSEMADELFDGNENQQVHIDLRFCNILDGYIPLVKTVRSIVPPLPKVGLVEVSWQEEPSVWITCTVSKEKRAIYNLDGKLKTLFKRFDSGVRLYITRVGSRRYKLTVKHHPHTVRGCKFFVPDERDGWRVEVRDTTVEWETGNEVFRHQLTFEQMEALHAEARRTNLSVRDAVYKVMKQLCHLERVHVRDVWDAVFLPLRTCSLASVWAQFRPEHECYERVSPGYYRFDSSKPLPIVRYVTTAHQRKMITPALGDTVRARRTKIHVQVRWRLLGKDCDDEVFDTTNSAQTMANFLGSLIREYGSDMAEHLTRIPVSRGHSLSRYPDVHFLNQENGLPFDCKLVPGTKLYVLTNSATQEKHDDIVKLVTELGLRRESIEVSIVPNPTRAETGIF